MFFFCFIFHLPPRLPRAFSIPSQRIHPSSPPQASTPHTFFFDPFLLPLHYTLASPFPFFLIPLCSSSSSSPFFIFSSRKMFQMSTPGKNVQNPCPNSLSEGFRDSLRFVPDKPDLREFDPVSPLTNTRILGSQTSSSSSSGSVPGKTPRELISGGFHSGELSRAAAAAATKGIQSSGHRRSNSCGAAALGGSSATSATVNLLPAGNICPSGRIQTSAVARRSDVLGSGGVNRGHGSIMRGSSTGEGGGRSQRGDGSVIGSDAEAMKREGNEEYRKGRFSEALRWYDKAVALSPEKAAYRSNRAAALTGIGRLVEAVGECEEAVRLEPGYSRAHQRLASLLIRFGNIESSRKHFNLAGNNQDLAELRKMNSIEVHIGRAFDARKVNEWGTVLRETDAAIAAGADSSLQLFACRAEALLNLQRPEDAEASFPIHLMKDTTPQSLSFGTFFGINREAYPFFVQSQIELALGRFEDAALASEKAGHIDPQNPQVSTLHRNVRLAARARAHGNDLFKSERFTEASSAYGEGLRLSPFNPVLYCNRAACWYKLGMWDKSVDDCNHALNIQPDYTKALLRKAACNVKLERWSEAVKDYTELRERLPDDSEVAESLFHAQVALRQMLGEEVREMKFGGGVERLDGGIEQLRGSVSSPGISVVHFMSDSEPRCGEMSRFLRALCCRYPTVNFIEVDVQLNRGIGEAESVRVMPTLKIYRGGMKVKEMICPTQQVLDSSVRHYNCTS